MAADRPSGTVAFLFTDVEGSTRAWRDDTESMAARLAAHDDLLRRCVARHGGYVFSTAGDSFAVAFHTIADAVSAAVDAQRGLDDSQLRVRMGIHHGRSVERDDDYFGPVVNTAARIMSAAHGGQVLVSATAASAARSTGTDLDTIDLGDHRLKDIGAPLRLLQVVVPGQDPRFPPLRSLDPFVSTLPSVRRPLIGRAGELERVGGALREHRLVTLWGPGGAGKTALALAVAGSDTRRSDHPDGVFFADLAPTRDRGATIDAIATGAQLRLESDGDHVDAMAAGLRDRRCLIVLDNCEHVAEHVAPIVDALLDRCPGLSLLTTSREALRVPGEHLEPLGGLGGGGGPPEDDPAVQLLLGRVAASGPAWSPEPDELAQCRRLVEQLDRLPLAVELAAARLPHVPVATIRAQLADSIGPLRSNRRTVDDRHTTLTAALDWSVQHLEPAAVEAHERLSVMRGSFDRAAATAVLAADDDVVTDVLDELCAKALLVLESGPGVRYRQLETVRRHAADRMGRARRDESWRRHVVHFSGLARHRFERSPARGSNISVAHEVDADEANLVAALDRSDAVGIPGTVPYLVLAHSFQWVLRNDQELLARWVARAAEDESADPDAHCVLMAHHALARPPAEMVVLAGRAREYGRRHAPDVAAVPEAVVAAVPCTLMQPDAAERAAGDVRRASERSRHRSEFAPLASFFEAAAAAVCGEHELALRSYRAALDELGDELWDWTMWCLVGAAVVLLLTGRPERAIDLLSSAEGDAGRFRSHEQIEYHATLAAARTAVGDVDAAHEEMTDASRRFAGTPRRDDNLLTGFAMVRVMAGDLARARELFDALSFALSPHQAPLSWRCRADAAGWRGDMSDFVGRELVRRMDAATGFDPSESNAVRARLLAEEVGSSGAVTRAPGRLLAPAELCQDPVDAER